jgi:chromate transport protein ChrA
MFTKVAITALDAVSIIIVIVMICCVAEIAAKAEPNDDKSVNTLAFLVVAMICAFAVWNVARMGLGQL